jgi:hypothetical protein
LKPTLTSTQQQLNPIPNSWACCKKFLSTFVVYL